MVNSLEANSTVNPQEIPSSQDRFKAETRILVSEEVSSQRANSLQDRLKLEVNHNMDNPQDHLNSQDKLEVLKIQELEEANNQEVSSHQDRLKSEDLTFQDNKEDNQVRFLHRAECSKEELLKTFQDKEVKEVQQDKSSKEDNKEPKEVNKAARAIKEDNKEVKDNNSREFKMDQEREEMLEHKETSLKASTQEVTWQATCHLSNRKANNGRKDRLHKEASR